MEEINVKADIDLLINVVRPELVAADKSGNSELFNKIGEEFGPVAHRVYLTLDKPERSCERYHDRSTRRVMLDPWTVLNRTNSFKDSAITIDDLDMWLHGDMIKALIDYLLLIQDKEVIYAGAA